MTTKPVAATEWKTRRPLQRALDVIVLTIAFGIAAGFVHTAELAVAQLVQGELVWFSRDFIWMSPIAYTLVLLTGGLLLAILALTSGSRWLLALAVFSTATAAVFGVMLPYSAIARIVSLFLAAVIGVQLARLTLASPTRALRGARRFAVAGGLVVCTLALAMPGLRRWRENRALASAMETGDAPSILVIILDTVRAASFGLYNGAPATTPRLSEWAREGTVFDNAYAPAPWTLPSHASFFTGRYAPELSADWEVPLGSGDSTLAQVVGARGYATGAFVGNMHYTAWDSGLDRGFATYQDYRLTRRQVLYSSSYTQTRLFRHLRSSRSLGEALREFRDLDFSIDPKHFFDPKRADEVSVSFLDWQQSLGSRPFFAFLNYFDAHRTYYSPREFKTFPRSKSGMHEYHAAIAWLDSQVGGVLDSLRARGALDRTVVIVTSDHGELFEEHNLSGHAHNLYRNVLWVPLYVRFPNRVPANRRVDATVSLRDLPATIVDLAGVAAAPFPGTSLATTWSGASSASPAFAEVRRAPNVSSAYPTSRGSITSLTDSSGHYIRYGDGAEELFAWRVDPAETRNLAAGDNGATERWRTRLDSLMQQMRPRRR